MDDFETMFPRSSVKFGVSAVAADRWKAEMEAGGLIVTGQVILLAGDLLRFCASYRQRANLFALPHFSLKFSQFREAYAAMARKPFSRDVRPQSADFSGFVEFRLDDEQIAELDGWNPTAMDVFGYCDRLVQDGFKVSLSYNANNKLATCSLMDGRRKLADGEKNPAAGKMLSTSDTDCSLALKAAIYKHFLVLECSWVSLLDQPSRGGQRG